MDGLSLQSTLPFLGVGAITLLISLCFCCFMRRLRKHDQQKNAIYKTGRYKKPPEESSEICPICLDDFTTGVKVATCSCNHQFHSKCLLQWLSSSATCPICKRDLLHSPPEQQESIHLVSVAGPPGVAV